LDENSSALRSLLIPYRGTVACKLWGTRAFCQIFVQRHAFFLQTIEQNQHTGNARLPAEFLIRPAIRRNRKACRPGANCPPRALMMKPKLSMLDDPTLGLAPVILISDRA